MASQFGSPGTKPAAAIPLVEARYDIEQVRQILPQLIDGLADAVLVVDRNRQVVAANRRYLETFVARGSHVLGMTCQEGVTCPLGDPSLNPGTCPSCEVISHRKSRKLLQAMPDRTGVLRRWEASLNPILDEQGEVSHVVEVWRDINDRSQLEGQLAHSERLASLGMLAAGVAHELNNPMASIVAGLDSLKRWLERARGLDAESAAEAIEVLDMIERETVRSRETTDKLLLLAQPYSGKSTWVDVNRAGRDTITLLAYQTRKQNIQVIESFDPEIPPIWARDPGIRGVWMNLCMNAVQAMPGGGTLTVRTEARPTAVAFEVTDTGHGIAPEHMERIWDPFFTTKPPGKGTGLGLSITQRVVHRHAGTIDVRSIPGEGTTFVVELPIHGPGGERV